MSAPRPTTSRRLMIALLGVLVVASSAAPASAATLPAGTFVFDAPTNAVAHDAATGATYVGGGFTHEQAETGAGLIVPSTGSGAPDRAAFPHVAGVVHAVVPDGAGGWYVGGRFVAVGGIARADLAHIKNDGTVDPAWHPDSDGEVHALAMAGSTVYAGGTFNTIGGITRHRLAAIDATTGAVGAWQPVADDDVRSLAVSGSTVYAAGDFTSLGGHDRYQAGALDTTTGALTGWLPAPNGRVSMLTVSGSTVYVAGGFSTIGGQGRVGLAALDATTGAATSWNPAPDNDCFTVAVSGSTVYAGGNFGTIGGQSRNGLAALDAVSGNATAWNPAPDNGVDQLAVTGATVFATGGFTSIGGQPRPGAAALSASTGDATAWNPYPGGLVHALVAAGSSVYVGGEFAGAGPLLATVRGVARLTSDGSLQTDWHPNPDAVPVSALALSGSTLYAGGSFTTIGGQSRSGLAALDAGTGVATGWNPSPTGSVTTLAVSGSTVYAAGNFVSIGGQSRAGLAALSASTGDATGWDPAPDSNVLTLVVSGSTVYAGGMFTSIGGQSRTGLAALDAGSGTATAWDPGLSPFGMVSALAVSGSTVYAGGAFTSAGAHSRNNLAALSATTGIATSWNPNPGPLSAVNALATSGSEVYAGGTFATIGGQLRTGLAALTSTGAATGWNPAPDPPMVAALATSGAKLYAAGHFTSMGGLVTGPYAQLTDPDVPVDDTPPVITITKPTEGQHLAKGQSVTSAFSCSDGSGSGVATCTGPAMVDTAASGAHTFTVNATDNAANSTSKTVHYVVDPPDTTPPTIAITRPAEGQHVAFGQSVASAYTCSDPGGSGVANCTGPAILATASAGAKTFTVTAADRAGNHATKTVHYTVDPPSNRFTLTSAKVSRTTITLAARLPGPGRLAVIATAKISGKKLTYATKTLTVRAGTTTLRLTPSSKAKSALKKVRSAKVAVVLTFTPTGGTPASTTRTVTVKGAKR